MNAQVLETAEEVSVGAGISSHSSARSSNSSSNQSSKLNVITGGLEMFNQEEEELEERLRQERERKLNEIEEEYLEPRSNAVSTKGGWRAGKPSQGPYSRKNSLGSSQNPPSQRQFSNKNSAHKRSKLRSPRHQLRRSQQREDR